MISLADLGSMESRVNASLARFRAELKFSKHFVYLRLNDPRNVPPLALAELEDIWHRFIAQHIGVALALPDRETFNIRCLRTAINIPCELRTPNASAIRQIVAITIMRHPTFYSKDRHDFHVR
jgi:hypothetical protein